MAKYELRPLSDSRKADIARSALAQNSAPAKPAASMSSGSASMQRSRDNARVMMDRAFRTIVAKG
ncbi:MULTISPECIES: hypothetical protein [Enterobacterales]|uniref:hypothetical protein n=1 Tax=Enterobacterales TaxID=91347 RepID=UPI0011A08C89|nr:MULTISPECIES: hypothetical protein [Enterobacterales]MBT0387068.1 hypothetical protein [Morganella morganii subsp. morganii]